MKQQNRVAQWFTTIFICMVNMSISSAQYLPPSDIDTWCIGRYLIDLPKGTTVETQYMTKGASVETLPNVSLVQFLETVADRRKLLNETPHDKGGFMLVDTDSIANNCITLVSWGSVVGRRTYKYETFQYIEAHKALYIFTGRGSATEEQRTIAARVQRSSYDELRYRAPMEIPEEAGFCINEGLIITSMPNREEYTAVIRLSEYPGVVMVLESYVTNNPGKFSKEGAPIGLSVVNHFHRKMLRNRSRPVGNAKGREFLSRDRRKRNGKIVYHFEWKTYGIKRSMNFPYMRLTLRTEDDPTRRSFANDKEALALWDSILGSLRLRPVSAYVNKE